MNGRILGDAGEVHAAAFKFDEKQHVVALSVTVSTVKKSHATIPAAQPPAVPREVMRPALLRAGLPEEFRAHDLRHAGASPMISLGAHPKLVMERLGHSDIRIAMGFYGHVVRVDAQARNPAVDELYVRTIAAPVEAADGSLTQLFA